MLVFPEPPVRGHPTRFIDREFIIRAFNRLVTVRKTHVIGKPHPVPFDDDAAKHFRSWLDVHLAAGDNEPEGRIVAAWGKMQGQVMRLALVFTYADWAVTKADQEPQSINLAAVKRAIDFIDGYMKPMNWKVYSAAVIPAEEEDAAQIAKHLKREGLKEFNIRKLRRESHIPGLREPKVARAACNWLEEVEVIRRKSTGTRAIVYEVNPVFLPDESRANGANGANGNEATPVIDTIGTIGTPQDIRAQFGGVIDLDPASGPSALMRHEPQNETGIPAEGAESEEWRSQAGLGHVRFPGRHC